jgi:hypothetical protein
VLEVHEDDPATGTERNGDQEHVEELRRPRPIGASFAMSSCRRAVGISFGDAERADVDSDFAPRRCAWPIRRDDPPVRGTLWLCSP